MRLFLNTDIVKTAMNERGWDEKKFADAIGVSKIQVYRVLRGQREPGNAFIAGICHTFEFDKLKEFFLLSASCQKANEEGESKYEC